LAITAGGGYSRTRMLPLPKLQNVDDMGIIVLTQYGRRTDRNGKTILDLHGIYADAV